jgi:hypothetical protein
MGRLGKRGDRRGRLGRAHLAQRQVDGVGQVAGLEVLREAHVDEQRVLLEDQTHRLIGVEQHRLVGEVRQGAQVVAVRRAEAEHRPLLGDPLLVAADHEADVDAFAMEVLAEFRAAVAGLAQQHGALAGHHEAVPFGLQVRVAAMPAAVDGAHLDLLGLAHVDQVERCLALEPALHLLGGGAARVLDLFAVRQGLQRGVADLLAGFLRGTPQVGGQAAVAGIDDVEVVEQEGAGRHQQADHCEPERPPRLVAPAGRRTWLAAAREHAATEPEDQETHDLRRRGEQVHQDVGGRDREHRAGLGSRDARAGGRRAPELPGAVRILNTVSPDVRKSYARAPGMAVRISRVPAADTPRTWRLALAGCRRRCRPRPRRRCARRWRGRGPCRPRPSS